VSIDDRDLHIRLKKAEDDLRRAGIENEKLETAIVHLAKALGVAMRFRRDAMEVLCTDLHVETFIEAVASGEYDVSERGSHHDRERSEASAAEIAHGARWAGLQDGGPLRGRAAGPFLEPGGPAAVLGGSETDPGS
jgi:hypothetical protein